MVGWSLYGEASQSYEQEVNPGDVIEVENTDHTFENRTDVNAKFLVIKQVLSGTDKSDLLKDDKILS